jgi:RNA polymerase sigma-70 factor (ECF subfamily)
MIISLLAIPDEQPLHQAHIMQMRHAQQDHEAFAPLYEHYVDRVYMFCLRRSASPQEAEDLCSQVFVRALQGLETYQGGLVAAWLFRIARNVVANHYRDRKPIIWLGDVDIPNDDYITESIEHEQDCRIISDLISSLPTEKQLLLSLSLDSGLTSSEIGEVLNKSAEAVRVELHRTIKRLRERYFQIFGETQA